MNRPAVLKDNRACAIYNDKSGRWPIGFPVVQTESECNTFPFFSRSVIMVV